MQNKDIDFEIKFLFGMYQVLQDHLLWLEVDMVTFSGYFFNADQRFFDFKINFFKKFVSNASRLPIISRVIHVLYVDWPLMQNKGY